MDIGTQTVIRRTVTEEDTARALGSGDLEVLATPRLLAWAEAATCEALAGHLDERSTSVGTRVQLDHVGASPVGTTLRVSATTVYVDGRLVRFEVVAEHEADDRLVGHGEVTRVVVDRERFLSRLG